MHCKITLRAFTVYPFMIPQGAMVERPQLFPSNDVMKEEKNSRTAFFVSSILFVVGFATAAVGLMGRTPKKDVQLDDQKNLLGYHPTRRACAGGWGHVSAQGAQYTCDVATSPPYTSGRARRPALPCAISKGYCFKPCCVLLLDGLHGESG